MSPQLPENCSLHACLSSTRDYELKLQLPLGLSGMRLATCCSSALVKNLWAPRLTDEAVVAVSLLSCIAPSSGRLLATLQLLRLDSRLSRTLLPICFVRDIPQRSSDLMSLMHSQCLIFLGLLWPRLARHRPAVQFLQLLEELLAVFVRIGAAASLGLRLYGEAIAAARVVFRLPDAWMQ